MAQLNASVSIRRAVVIVIPGRDERRESHLRALASELEACVEGLVATGGPFSLL